jgi:hypothetical protein
MDIEIAKLLTSTLTPLTLVFIGYYVNKTLAQQREKKRDSEKLIQKRLEIYSKIALPLNEIYCYVQDVGDYKALNPDIILKNKRISDRLFHMYRPIWRKKTIYAYKKFSGASFTLFNGSGTDAKIRTVSKEKKAAEKLGNGKWRTEWAERITEERDPDYHRAFVELMNAFSFDLGYQSTRHE